MFYSVVEIIWSVKLYVRLPTNNTKKFIGYVLESNNHDKIYCIIYV